MRAPRRAAAYKRWYELHLPFPHSWASATGTRGRPSSTPPSPRTGGRSPATPGYGRIRPEATRGIGRRIIFVGQFAFGNLARRRETLRSIALFSSEVMTMLKRVLVLLRSALARWRPRRHPPRLPSKTVKIIVGTSPGGSPDTFGRLIAQKMSESWGPVVVENRIGANGNIAAEAVSKAAPDGYTAYVCDSAILGDQPAPVRESAVPAAGGFRRRQHDLDAADLPHRAPVAPGDDLRGVHRVRESESRQSFPTPRAGNGSIHHITTELFKSLAGISMVHVPYKGMGQAVPALLAGDVQVAFSSYTAMAQYAKAGRVRILASADGKRTPALPDVPTIAELGIPSFDMASMLGMLAPAGTPRDIVAKLNAGVVAAVASPELNEKIAGFGVRIGTSTPEQFDALMRAEYEKYARLVKLSGAKLD